MRPQSLPLRNITEYTSERAVSRTVIWRVPATLSGECNNSEKLPDKHLRMDLQWGVKIPRVLAPHVSTLEKIVRKHVQVFFPISSTHHPLIIMAPNELACDVSTITFPH